MGIANLMFSNGIQTINAFLGVNKLNARFEVYICRNPPKNNFKCDEKIQKNQIQYKSLQ